jgi:hypothetical protein
MHWWKEIMTTGGAANIRFGGPTGMYNFVVLMSWWSSLLKDQPDDKLTDYLRTLEDIDHAILSAVRNMNGQPPTPSPNEPSLGTPPIPPVHESRGSKRNISEGGSIRKRSRYE